MRGFWAEHWIALICQRLHNSDLADCNFWGKPKLNPLNLKLGKRLCRSVRLMRIFQILKWLFKYVRSERKYFEIEFRLSYLIVHLV